MYKDFKVVLYRDSNTSLPECESALYQLKCDLFLLWMDNVLYPARFFGNKPPFFGICGGESAIGTGFFL
jgi:hypothetical protein